MKIGILSFQGDVVEHEHALQAIGVVSQRVASVAQLDAVDGLIVPGGESTVISKFVQEAGVGDRLIEKCMDGFPVYGTCAGAILVSKYVTSHGEPEERVLPLGLIDIDTERNAYGSQMDSFEQSFVCQLGTKECNLAGIFIRAPQITRTGDSVEVLLAHNDRPILCQQGSILVSTFHPELGSGVSVVHRYFVDMVLDGR